jgi:hypothetical protein
MVPRSLFLRSAHLLVASSLVASSCTPAAPPAETPTVAVGASPPADPGPAPTYEPVAEPGNLGGLLRIGSPVRDLVMWRDLLPAHTPFGQLAALGPAGLAELTFGSLGEFVDTSAPVDMAILEGDSVMVGSVALRDLGQARSAAAEDFDFRARADGSISVVPRDDAERTGLVGKFRLACRVYLGGEPTRSHLVCSENVEALESAGPYLARTVSRKAVVPGIRYEMPESAMRRLLAGRREVADALAEEDPAAEAGRQVAARWLKELEEDFESMAMDVSAGAGGVNVGVDLRFRSVRSPLSLVAVGSRGGAVPAAFWSVPSDADLALYVPGASPDALRTALGTFWKDIGEAIPDDEIPKQAWRDFVTELSKLVLTGGPVVVAHGAAPAKPSASGQGTGPVKAQAKAADPAKVYRDARTASAGWLAFSVSEPASKWTGGVREMLRVSNTAKKSAPAGGARGGAAAPSKPASKKKPSRTTSTTKEVAVRASEGLPAGTLHLVHHEAPNPAHVVPQGGQPAPEGPYDQHVFITGTADATWIVVSENEALARAKVQEIMKGSTGGIQGRADLAALRSLPAGGIGFATLRGLVALLGDQDTGAELAASEALLAKVGLLPSAGTAPIFLSLASSGNEHKEGATLRVSASISIAAALDLVQWLQ